MAKLLKHFGFRGSLRKNGSQSSTGEIPPSPPPAAEDIQNIPDPSSQSSSCSPAVVGSSTDNSKAGESAVDPMNSRYDDPYEDEALFDSARRRLLANQRLQAQQQLLAQPLQVEEQLQAGFRQQLQLSSSDIRQQQGEDFYDDRYSSSVSARYYDGRSQDPRCSVNPQVSIVSSFSPHHNSPHPLCSNSVEAPLDLRGQLAADERKSDELASFSLYGEISVISGGAPTSTRSVESNRHCAAIQQPVPLESLPSQRQDMVSMSDSAIGRTTERVSVAALHTAAPRQVSHPTLQSPQHPSPVPRQTVLRAAAQNTTLSPTLNNYVPPDTHSGGLATPMTNVVPPLSCVSPSRPTDRVSGGESSNVTERRTSATSSAKYQLSALYSGIDENEDEEHTNNYIDVQADSSTLTPIPQQSVGRETISCSSATTTGPPPFVSTSSSSPSPKTSSRNPSSHTGGRLDQCTSSPVDMTAVACDEPIDLRLTMKRTTLPTGGRSVTSSTGTFSDRCSSASCAPPAPHPGTTTPRHGEQGGVRCSSAATTTAAGLSTPPPPPAEATRDLVYAQPWPERNRCSSVTRQNPTINSLQPTTVVNDTYCAPPVPDKMELPQDVTVLQGVSQGTGRQIKYEHEVGRQIKGEPVGVGRQTRGEGEGQSRGEGIDRGCGQEYESPWDQTNREIEREFEAQGGGGRRGVEEGGRVVGRKSQKTAAENMTHLSDSPGLKQSMMDSSWSGGWTQGGGGGVGVGMGGGELSSSQDWGSRGGGGPGSRDWESEPIWSRAGKTWTPTTQPYYMEGRGSGGNYSVLEGGGYNVLEGEGRYSESGDSNSMRVGGRQLSVAPPRSPDMVMSASLTLGERIDPRLPLEQQNWYHGAISRLDAEMILRVYREGSYLVRNSESNRRDFSLSIKSTRGFMHLKISANQSGRYILGQFSQPFYNIPQMIYHYSIHKLPVKGAEHMSLMYPVSNEEL